MVFKKFDIGEIYEIRTQEEIEEINEKQKQKRDLAVKLRSYEDIYKIEEKQTVKITNIKLV